MEKPLQSSFKTTKKEYPVQQSFNNVFSTKPILKRLSKVGPPTICFSTRISYMRTDGPSRLRIVLVNVYCCPGKCQVLFLVYHEFVNNRRVKISSYSNLEKGIKLVELCFVKNKFNLKLGQWKLTLINNQFHGI